MKSRRVSIAICAATLLSMAHAASAETRTQEPPTVEESISDAIKASKALSLLDYYKATSPTDMRFLVVIDRIAEKGKARAPDLLASRDGKLWILDHQRVRPVAKGDLDKHKFSLDEAQKGLKSSSKRPVSVVLPRRLVGTR